MAATAINNQPYDDIDRGSGQLAPWSTDLTRCHGQLHVSGPHSQDEQSGLGEVVGQGLIVGIVVASATAPWPWSAVTDSKKKIHSFCCFKVD
jgi:hypothetical protein